MAPGAPHRRRGLTPRRWSGVSLSGRRTAWGWSLAVLGPPGLTWVLLQLRAVLDLPTDLMLFLTLVVTTAIIGGLAPSLVCALLASSLLNFFFTEPTGGLTVADPENALALVVFVLVAVAVASVVDLAERRRLQAGVARSEADALAELSRAVLAGQDTPQAIAAELARRFGASTAAVLERPDATAAWRVVAVHDARLDDRGDDGNGTGRSGNGTDWSSLPAGPYGEVVDTRLALPGHHLDDGQGRALQAFTAQAALVLDRERLRRAADRSRDLEHMNTVRTAILTAASHDLRTPLASIRAAVDGLGQAGFALDDADRTALVETIDLGTGRLERLIDNLLDLSRLQLDAVAPSLRVVSLDEVVPPALEGLDPAAVELVLPEGLPMVRTDPGLLERVLANIVENAVRHSPAGSRVVVSASEDSPLDLAVTVTDRGVGVHPDDRDRIFDAFTRLDQPRPGPAGGMGLGLAVAKGLADAVHARLRVAETPGGGLTVTVVVPRADPADRTDARGGPA